MNQNTKHIPDRKPLIPTAIGIKEGLAYRLPIMFLFPTSLTLFLMDKALYESSGQDELIYFDATVRFGMSGGFRIMELFFLIGSLLMIGSIAVFIRSSIIKKSVNLYNAGFIGLGILSHPWVFGIFFDMIMMK